MKKFLGIAVLVLVMDFLVAPAYALQLQVDDVIRISQTGYNDPLGGEYRVREYYTGSSLGNTFCAEMGETIYLNAPYRVASVQEAAIAGNGSNITEQEAYLMTQYWAGNYSNSNFADLQRALWYFQGHNYYSSFVDIANAAVGTSWTGIGNVRVATLQTLAGNRAQDIYTQVPEPGTMFLLGAGLFGLAILTRKKFLK